MEQAKYTDTEHLELQSTSIVRWLRLFTALKTPFEHANIRFLCLRWTSVVQLLASMIEYII